MERRLGATWSQQGWHWSPQERIHLGPGRLGVRSHVCPQLTGACIQDSLSLQLPGRHVSLSQAVQIRQSSSCDSCPLALISWSSCPMFFPSSHNLKHFLYVSSGVTALFSIELLIRSTSLILSLLRKTSCLWRWLISTTGHWFQQLDCQTFFPGSRVGG